MDRIFRVVAKTIAYTGGLLVALVVLLRGIVPALWGSGSDIGLLGAVVLGLLGLLVILWLAFKAIQNIVGEITPPVVNNFYNMGGDVMNEDQRR